MKFGLTFSELLTDSIRIWKGRTVDQCIFSLALPIQEIDPLIQLADLAKNEHFRFLWDVAPQICIAAAGQCQQLSLLGPRRYELSQQFTNEVFGQLLDASNEAPEYALPKILYSFSFFDHNKQEIKGASDEAFSLQAVLPKWQLTHQRGASWLRINCSINNNSGVRNIVEELWAMREKLTKYSSSEAFVSSQGIYVQSVSMGWKEAYRGALARGIELVKSGELHKLVLASKQSIVLDSLIDPLLILFRLRSQQSGSCRFLWQCGDEESFFGASPERLISFHNGQLRTDALAGTAIKDDDGKKLLSSIKDLREHELVVNSLIKQLNLCGLRPYKTQKPQLLRQGHLMHLHTPIFASARGHSPLPLVSALHPTPAVAGIPLQKAKNWIQILESFDRGNYGAPLGWIDSNNNADFRVAIRCAYLRGQNLDLIAGAGLVDGSVLELELQEVELKLRVLLDQFNLDKVSRS